MIRLEPVIHPTIWGGDKLKKFLTEYNDLPKQIGHLYLVNGHEGMTNVVSEGDYKGYTLKELFDKKKGEWGLGEYDEFPLTVALVDAAESLSIQIHPDSSTALELEGKEIGKEESWYFIDNPKEGFIFFGSNLENMDDIDQAVQNDRMEDIIGRKKIEKGDYFCIKEGTLHAMSAGSFVYEVEYGSDITYRFYDYHRKDDKGSERELHVDKAFKAMKINRGKEARVIKPSSGEWIRENNYEIMIQEKKKTYKNEGTEIECVTDLEKGRGILLFPGEIIEDISGPFAVARLIRD